MTARRKDTRITKLGDELDALEREAGITEEASAKAREGAFIPFGALGDEYTEFTSRQNNQLYFDSEHDARRRKVRQLYFSVEPSEVRRKLIGKQRELSDALMGSFMEDIEEAERQLEAAKHKAEQLPWSMAAFVAGLWVFVGYWAARHVGVSEIVGALAGMLVGFFFGQGVIHNRKRELANEVRQAEENVNSARGSEARSQPEYFNLEEELSGTENKDFGRETAFGNRVQEFAKANAK